MNYVWDFAILGKYSHLFWTGIGWTLAYTIGTVLLGSLLGLIVGILRLKKLAIIDWPLIGYVELFRCTPLLVQIIWFYYAFPVVIGVNIPAHLAAVSVLTLYGLANPSLQSLTTRLVGPSEQGQLQGANSSMNGIANMAAPILFTQVFALAVGRYRHFNLSGAPFLLAAAFLLGAIVVGWRVTAGLKDSWRS